MKGNNRSPGRSGVTAPEDVAGSENHEANGHGMGVEPGEGGVATDVAEHFSAAPFRASSPSVELDPERLAQELRAENVRLNHLLEQARTRLLQAEQTAAQWGNREQVYENLLEEKSELIRELHQQVQDLRARPAATPASDQAAPNEDELVALHGELERERQQLRDDEQALMEQMRGMEVQMATERANLARQRNELQRLHNELQHQLEIASRDAALRDRLAPLYRLQEELQLRQGGQSGMRPRAPTIPAPQQVQPPPPATLAGEQPRGSGFFRRMFNRDR
jgi:hypothetical protein